MVLIFDLIMKKRKYVLQLYYDLLGKGNFKIFILNLILNNLFKEIIILKKFEFNIFIYLRNY